MFLPPDNKWVVIKPAKGGQLSMVPAGAGESRQLTHDSVSYRSMRFLPDGKHLLAAGIETGHGVRDYLIDVSTGESKPVTPEGVAGTRLSPDGSAPPCLAPMANGVPGRSMAAAFTRSPDSTRNRTSPAGRPTANRCTS